MCFSPYRSSSAFQRTLPGALPGLSCSSANGACSSLPYLIKQEKSMGYKLSSIGSGVHSASQRSFQNCRAGQVLEMPRDEIVGAPHVSNNGNGVCTPSDVGSGVSGDAVQPFNNEDNSSPLALSPAGPHHSARLLSTSSLKRRCLSSQSTVAASVAVTSSSSVTGAACEDVSVTAIVCSSSQSMSMVACVNAFRTNVSPSHTSRASFSSSSSSSSTSPPSNSCLREATQRPPPHSSPQQVPLHESCQLSSPATCLLSHSSSSSSSSSVSSLEPEQGQGQSQGLCDKPSSMLQGRGAGGTAGGGVGGGGGTEGLGLLVSGALMSGMLHFGPEAGALLDGGQRSAASLKQEPLDDFSPSEDELFQHHYHPHLSGRSGNLRLPHHPPRPAMPPPYHLHQCVGASPGGQLLHQSQQTSPASSLGLKPTSGGPPGSHTVPEREEVRGGALADKQVCRWIDCSAVYEQQEELVRHIEKVHIDQRKGEDFTCFWAGCIRRYKPFNARYKLLIHMRVHSGEKPNKCMVSHHKPLKLSSNQTFQTLHQYIFTTHTFNIADPLIVSCIRKVLGCIY